ncbi:MAG TPA: DoxX family protein [Gemmatimonadales bacterium]
MHKAVRLTLRVTLLLLTLLEGLGMAGAGLGKFRNQVWHDAFVIWGYPMWFMYAVGAVEMIGGLALFVPRVASWAAMGLMAVMIGAVVTSLHHPIVEPRFTWVTPAMHLCFLSALAAARWRDRWRALPQPRL